MICKNCGKNNLDTSAFCFDCGKPLDRSAPEVKPQASVPPRVQPQPVYNNAYRPPVASVIPPENKPISAWGYYGYKLLFTIPLIGFIMLLVFSFGGTSNVNLKNFARSYWCEFLIGLLLGAILVILFVAMGGTAAFMDALYQSGF